MPENINRNAAARVPIAADSQPPRIKQGRNLFADAQRAVFMKTAMIAEAGQEEFEALAFYQPIVWGIVDDQMCKVWLAGYRTQRGEFGRDETG